MRGFIAIDGGGSKTEVVLVNVKGNILSHKIISCTNPNDIGLDSSFYKLDGVIKEFFNIANDNGVDIETIMLAIAGIEFGNLKELLKERLIKSLNYENIIIDGDLASVKELGLANHENGVVIISGTGFNMAIKENGVFSHVGGWGYLADDYLSGFDLGKDALICASNAIDGSGTPTILVELLEKHFNCSLWYAMKEIYEGGVKKVASLSKLVIKAYMEQDEVAMNIINKRVDKLVKIIIDKTKNMNELIVVSLFGGIYENNLFIVDLLKQKLGDNYKVSTTNKKTIFGAVGLAKKIVKNVSEDFDKNFNNEYGSVL